MTTTITVLTVEGEKRRTLTLTVGDHAQAHVLRKFNPTDNEKVDLTKVLCAGLIQQMINLCEMADEASHTDDGEIYARAKAQWRVAGRAIEAIEDAQMLAVKANFAEA